MYGEDRASSPPPPPPLRAQPSPLLQKEAMFEPSPVSIMAIGTLFASPPPSPAEPLIIDTATQFTTQHMVHIELATPPLRPSSPQPSVSSLASEEYDLWGRTSPASPDVEKRRRRTSASPGQHREYDGDHDHNQPMFRLRHVVSVGVAPPPPRPSSPAPSLSTLESSEHDIWGSEPAPTRDPPTPPPPRGPTAADRAMFRALAMGDEGVALLRRAIHGGAHLDMVDDFGWTPLQIASTCGHDRLVRELVQHGAKAEESPTAMARRYLRTPAPTPAAQTGTRDFDAATPGPSQRSCYY